MKKTILAAAVAAAVMAAPMTAAANVVIYGKIHASIDYVDLGGGDFIYGNPLSGIVEDAAGVDSKWSVTNRTSRIGFKGSEDLGNGLKAIWKAEIGYDLTGDNGRGGWTSGRNSYIGLAGDWGTALIGKHDTPLKISTGRLDVFADTMADYQSTLGFVDRRTNNTIAYISPNWNGFTFAIAGVAAEEYGGNAGDGGYSLAAMYFNNGFYASLAWEDAGDLHDGQIGMPYPQISWLDSEISENQIWRVGLGYIMNAFTLGFVYEGQEANADLFSFGFEEIQTDINKWMISGAYDFGNNTVKAMYGQYDIDADITRFGVTESGSDKAQAWAIGIDHKLSVRTKVYALYADSELGLHNASAWASSATGVYQAPVYGGNGFSMGMVHTF